MRFARGCYLDRQLAHTRRVHGDDEMLIAVGAAGGVLVELLVFVAGEEVVAAAASPAVGRGPERAGALRGHAGRGIGHVIGEDVHGFVAVHAVGHGHDKQRAAVAQGCHLAADGAGGDVCAVVLGLRFVAPRVVLGCGVVLFVLLLVLSIRRLWCARGGLCGRVGGVFGGGRPHSGQDGAVGAVLVGGAAGEGEGCGGQDGGGEAGTGKAHEYTV